MSADLPSTPQPRKDFRETQPDRELDSSQKKDISRSQPVSKKQQEALEAQRPEAKMNLTHTPGGSMETNSNQAAEIERQEALERVRRIMRKSGKDMKKRFNRSR